MPRVLKNLVQKIGILYESVLKESLLGGDDTNLIGYFELTF